MAIYNLKLCICRRIERRAARQPARGVRRAGRRAMIGWERGPRGRSTTSSRRRPHCQLTSPARRSRQTGPSGEGRPGERAAAAATAPKGRTVGRAPRARTAMPATAQMTVQVLQHAPSLLLGRLIQLLWLFSHAISCHEASFVSRQAAGEGSGTADHDNMSGSVRIKLTAERGLRK